MFDHHIIWFVVVLTLLMVLTMIATRNAANKLAKRLVNGTVGILGLAVLMAFLLGKWADQTLPWVLIPAVGVLVLAFLIYVFVSRIARSLDEINRFCNALSKDGRNTSAPKIGTNNPFYTLLNNVNTIVDASTEKLKAKVEDAVARLSTLVSELTATTNLQTSGMNEQLSAINQTTTTTKQLATTSNQSTEKAEMVVKSAQKSMGVTSQGKVSVDETIEEMNQIRRRVERIAEEILDLSERTQQIGVIITTVNDIAEQTHMLALNAAIEASKAGESGKGFSVVAYEVRKLSEKSQEAALKIRELIGQIQDATNSTVMVTEEGSKRVDIGVEKIRRAGGYMEESIESLEENVNHAEQILIASKQQTIGIEQITLAMSNINDVVKQLVKSSYQTQEATESINSLAKELKVFCEEN